VEVIAVVPDHGVDIQDTTAAVVPDHGVDIQDTTAAVVRIAFLAEVTIMATALMAIMFTTTTTTDLQWLLLVAMATCWVTATIITAILATMD